MLVAIDGTKKRVRASPNSNAVCPHCEQEVISKCGGIKIWHWAHKTKCIYETEPMTEWHLWWQNIAENAGCIIEHIIGGHIVDAVDFSKKTIYEFQHSPISSDDLRHRSFNATNQGYKINWIFDYCAENNYKYQMSSNKDKNSLKLYRYSGRYDPLFQNGSPIFGKVFFDMGEQPSRTIEGACGRILKNIIYLKGTRAIFTDCDELGVFSNQIGGNINDR